MNFSLLAKWWRRYQFDSDALWKSILRVKYYSLFVGRISPFWSAISKVIPYMRINMKYLVGPGHNILFWFDIWYGELPFYIKYPNLFAKAKSPLTITLAQIWNLGNFKIPLTRGASLY
jgi:hypothetical protein